MKRFKNILLVFNSKTDNRALFDQAVDLAQRNRASLTVIDVIEEAPSSLAKLRAVELSSDVQKPTIPIIEELPFDTPLSLAIEAGDEDLEGKASTTEEPTIDIQEYIKQEEQSSLQQFITAIQKAGIQAKSKTIIGVPFIEIIREVIRNQHDLVMITAEGEDGLKESLFGSTSIHLMRKCPCPVWVIKLGQPRQFGRILAAVEIVQEDNERAALDKNIMELATSLARLAQSELLILHAWSMYGESILRGRGGVSDESMKMLLQETRDRHRQWMIKLLQKHPMDDLKTEVFLLKGDAGSLISEITRSKAIDLIVMGTVSRKGIAGFLIGNTAEKVLQQVNCSVLTIKPKGFTSPVKTDQM